jgi:hypothetical protein
MKGVDVRARQSYLLHYGLQKNDSLSYLRIENYSSKMRSPLHLEDCATKSYQPFLEVLLLPGFVGL